MKTKSNYFLHIFLLYFFGSTLTTQSVNGGRFSERDLDTLLLRSGHSIATDNEAVASEQVPKVIRDLVSSAPAVTLDTIPKRLQSVIQYALEQPYPGKGIEAPPGARSNKLKKSTIVYLITSRLRQRGNNNEVQVENETPSQEYGNPVEQTSNGYRTILQEQVKSDEKPVARTVLQPKSHYSGRNIQQQQQQGSEQSYTAPIGRSVSQSQQIRSYEDSPPQQNVLTIHPRPTPPSPDFEIIRTVSSEAGPILAAAQKQNLRSAYRAAAAYQYPSSQQLEIQEQTQPSSVRFVHTIPQQTVQQDVDEGLAVLGGPEGLSDIVSKIEGLGETPQPNQLVLTPDNYNVPLTVPVQPAPVPVDIVHQVNNDLPHPPPPPQQQQSHHHSLPNEYITYLNPPLVDQGKPISPIHFDGALKTLPFRRINRFFQNVLKSLRTNLASLRNYTPKITYENDPWQNGNHYNSDNAPAPSSHLHQNPNQPVLVSTTTYSGPPPPQHSQHHQHQH